MVEAQRTESWSGGEATVYMKLHAEKHKRHVPTMAGLIFITSITLVTFLLNLDRSQTWLPLGRYGRARLNRLIDDVLSI
jgi:phospho-N-acetylmuramoyl-pentapeptide-transferase